jgi:hypothetical protein
MKETDQAAFQDLVGQYLIRHRSILDVQSKLVESAARIARALAKAVTSCGCVQIVAERQRFPANLSLAEVREQLSTHLQGEPCERCRETLEDEVGTALFYLAALCHVTGLNLGAILRKERERVAALGLFHLT